MRKVILYPGEDGYWVAECPSLPGCTSQGKTRAKAAANIREAIEGYEAALEDIEANPEFLKMMDRTDADIRAGRVYTQNEVERHLRRKKETPLSVAIGRAHCPLSPQDLPSQQYVERRVGQPLEEWIEMPVA